MHRVVKGVFYLMGMATVALLLYWVFFGQDGNWEGALFWASRQAENPIAQYYHQYCYTPNVHATDYLDIELGCTVYGVSDPADFTGDMFNSYQVNDDSYISYPSGTHYSTGWR